MRIIVAKHFQKKKRFFYVQKNNNFLLEKYFQYIEENFTFRCCRYSKTYIFPYLISIGRMIVIFMPSRAIFSGARLCVASDEESLECFCINYAPSLLEKKKRVVDAIETEERGKFACHCKKVS